MSVSYWTQAKSGVPAVYGQFWQNEGTPATCPFSALELCTLLSLSPAMSNVHR